VSSMSGDFPVQLATRLPDWSRWSAAVLCCPFLRLSCRPPKSTSTTTRTTCCGQVASIFVASSSDRHVRHARLSRDMLATSSRGCHEDATRKLLPWNFSHTLQACVPVMIRGLAVATSLLYTHVTSVDSPQMRS